MTYVSRKRYNTKSIDVELESIVKRGSPCPDSRRAYASNPFLSEHLVAWGTKITPRGMAHTAKYPAVYIHTTHKCERLTDVF